MRQYLVSKFKVEDYWPVRVAMPFLTIPTAIPRIRAPNKIMLQTPIIIATRITIVRRGLRQTLRQASWRYMVKCLKFKVTEMI